MKKGLVKTSARVVFLLLVAGMFAACGNQSKSDSAAGETPIVDVTADTSALQVPVFYEFGVSDDLFRLGDFEIEYVDASGMHQKTSLKENPWKMSFETSKAGDYGFSVKATPKANLNELVKPDSVYRLGQTVDAGWKKNGQINKPMGLSGSSANFSLKGSQMKEYFERYAEKTFYSTSFAVK